jgi:cell division protein FtsW (lipid II flippase)
MLLLGLAAVLFWSLQFLWQSYIEPVQLALVGHSARWRQVDTKTKLVTVGTDRTHDIVLHDRKASPEHLVLRLKGNNWAELENRSRDRRILIQPGVADPKRGKDTIAVNRILLKDGDRFQIPISKSALKRGVDWCSPTEVLRLLGAQTSRDANNTKLQSNADTTRVSFVVGLSRNPLSSLFRSRARLVVGTKPSRRIRWLEEHRRYTLPKKLGSVLEYRYNGWSVGGKGKWRPLNGGLSWGKPKRRLEVIRAPKFASSRFYTFGKEGHVCRFPHRPQALPGGMVLAGRVRLQFQRSTLFLQHFGQPKTTIEVLSANGRARTLGAAPLHSGDTLLVGGLAYKVFISGEDIRLMIQRSPGSYFGLPFFANYRSERLSMRYFLSPNRTLLVTGGEGRKPGVDRWLVKTSILRDKGRPILRKPYLPLFTIQGLGKNDAFRLQPGEHTGLEWANASGKRLKQPITQDQTIRPSSRLLYGKRVYFRLFQPNYRGLEWWLALLWTVVAGGVVFLMFVGISSGRIPWSPIPHAHLLETLPEGDVRRAYLQPAGFKISLWWFGNSWRWLPVTLLFPMALFLNGLGLYVLHVLSLSALGLNNNGYLYRQTLWSLVGVVLFLVVFWWSNDWWKQKIVHLLGADRSRLQLDDLPWRQRRRFASHRILMGSGLLALLALAAATFVLKSFLVGLLVGVVVWLLVWMLGQQLLNTLGFRVKGIESPGLSMDDPWKDLWLQWRWWILGSCAVVTLFVSWLLQSGLMLLAVPLGLAALVFLFREVQQSRQNSARSKAMFFFLITLALLGFVPILRYIAPGLVHKGFFLRLPGIGTAKLSDFAILSAILFFAHYLGDELFGLQLARAQRLQSEGEEVRLEASRGQLIRESLLYASRATLLYLFLLALVVGLYIVQGDLGPGLIFTVCFSMFLVFAFFRPGADPWTTWGNLLRVGLAAGVVVVILYLPSLILSFDGDLSQTNSQLQKISQRLSLWQQPWRFMVGEQLLQNRWNLAGFDGAFQWFSNLHSDFVLTAVVRVLSPLAGMSVILITCLFPLFALILALLHWIDPQPGENEFLQVQKRNHLIRCLIVVFGGVYFFSQNVVHIGSVLNLTPMTGVTLTWVSSGGTNVIACYLVLALMLRQFRLPPAHELSEQEVLS